MNEFKVRGTVTKAPRSVISIHNVPVCGFHVVEDVEVETVSNPLRLDVIARGDLARTCARLIAVGLSVEVGGRLGRREMRRGRISWPSFSAVATSIDFLDPPPQIVELARVVHCKQDDYEVYIGRGRDPRDGRRGAWGNPYSHRPSGAPGVIMVGSAQEAVQRYEGWLWRQIKTGNIGLEALAALHGRTLGCWCMGVCHGAVLARAAAWAHGRLNGLA